MPFCNFVEYSDIHSKTSGRLWQYYRDEQVLYDNKVIIDFSDDNSNSISFQFKQQIIGQTGNNDKKDVEIMVPLKYLSNFWRTRETSVIICEIFLMLTWSKYCLLVAGISANQELTFIITDIKLYVPVYQLKIM